MGFVCFKNLCMIIIFILLTTYYISAFRLIHTHAELPETETKKDIKEHARKAYTLKDHDHKNQSIHVKFEGFETDTTPEKKVKTMQPTRTPDTLKEKIKQGLKSKDTDEEEKPKIKIIQKDIQGKSKFVALDEDSKKEEPKKSSKIVKESSVKPIEDKKVKSKEESSKIVKELFTKKVEDPTKSKIKIIQKDSEGKSKLVKEDGKIEIKKPSKEDTTKSKPKQAQTPESKTISKEESSKIVKELFAKKEEPLKPKIKIIQKDTEGKGKFVSVTDKSKEEISKVIKKEPAKTPPPPSKAPKTSEKPQKETPKIVKEPPVSQKKNSNFKRI